MGEQPFLHNSVYLSTTVTSIDYTSRTYVIIQTLSWSLRATKRHSTSSIQSRRLATATTTGLSRSIYPSRSAPQRRSSIRGTALRRGGWDMFTITYSHDQTRRSPHRPCVQFSRASTLRRCLQATSSSYSATRRDLQKRSLKTRHSVRRLQTRLLTQIT